MFSTHMNLSLGMSLHMALQIVLSSKIFATFFALEPFTFVMNSHVLLQLSQPPETLQTMGTAKISAVPAVNMFL